MKKSIEILEKIINEKRVEKIIMASPVSKNGIKKMEIKPLIIKDSIHYQLSFIKDNKAMHKNYSEKEILEILKEEIEQFKQINIFSNIEEIQVLRNSKGVEKIIKKVIEKKR